MATTKLERLLIDASLKAGKHLRDHAFDPGTIEWKGPNDPVTSRDKEAQDIILETILSKIPMNTITEEAPENFIGSKYTIIVDPLDGTKSYLRQDFDTAVSIAIAETSSITKPPKLIAGAVYDFMRDILYFAGPKNKFRLHHGQILPFQTDYDGPKIGLCVTKKGDLSGNEYLALSKLEFNEAYHLKSRRGSIALSMAQAASGVYKGMLFFPNKRSNPWDIAAGIYLLQRNGYKLTDIDANPFDFQKSNNGLIAAHKSIATEFYQDIKTIQDNFKEYGFPIDFDDFADFMGS